MMTSSCPVCDGADLAVYMEGGGETLEASAIGSSRKSIAPGRILRCRGCGFGFRQTRFNAEQLAELYRRMDPEVYQAELAGRRKTASRHLKIVQQNIRRGRLLDVGCASGLFLTLAADAGWQVVGLEPSEALCVQARAMLGERGEVFREILETARLPESHFDAVTLWDVLEHVPEPLAMLEKCRELLKPGGFLFLNVPDLDSRESRWLGARWPLLLPEHVNYFNRPSLKVCGERAGLDLVRFGRRRAVFSIRYVFLRLAQHRIPGAELGRKIAQTRAGDVLIPVSLGETYAVWRCPPEGSRLPR